MLTVQKRALDLAIRSLQACKAQYYIKDMDGNVFTDGSLIVKEAPAPKEPKTKRTSRCGLPRGELTKYVEGCIGQMQSGDVLQVPIYENGNMKSLHSAIASYGCRAWGAGSITTHRDYGNSCVEVMRIL